jgi:hypothetical protein
MDKLNLGKTSIPKYCRTQLRPPPVAAQMGTSVPPSQRIVFRAQSEVCPMPATTSTVQIPFLPVGHSLPKYFSRKETKRTILNKVMGKQLGRVLLNFCTE